MLNLAEMHFINTIKTESETFTPEFAKTLLNPLHPYNSEVFNYFAHPKYSTYLPQTYIKSNFNEYLDGDGFLDLDPANNEALIASSSHQNFQDYFSCQRSYGRHDFPEGDRKGPVYDIANQANLGQVWGFQNDTSCLPHGDVHDSSKEVYFDDTLDVNNSPYSDDSTGTTIFIF